MALIILHFIIFLHYHHTPMDQKLLKIDRVPPGRWAVGVSGGADSVALLRLLADRTDLHLHVVHLDHETREGESALDAKFVVQLATQFNLQCTIARRSEIEAEMPAISPNPSDRFRLARLALFHRVVRAQQLGGVILAHHADDQAETILMRLLRGAALENLGGIQTKSIVGGLTILRPLLDIRAADLRIYLNHCQQSWREDSSNQSPKYQRNIARQWLADRPSLHDPLIQLAQSSDALRQWLTENSPSLEPEFAVEQLSDQPRPLARHAAERWLIARGIPPTEINPQTCDRLIQMATDAASPPRQHFPGALLVRRKQKKISVEMRTD